MALIVTQSSSAQDHPLLNDGKLYIDSMFMDNSNRLIYSKVVSFDSLSQSTLIKKTKNCLSEILEIFQSLANNITEITQHKNQEQKTK